MLRSWVFLLALALPSPAFATILLAYGDSLTGAPNGAPTLWPKVLQRLRPDLTVVSAGVPGDVSSNVPRFRMALDAHAPELVTVMLGTNDVLCAAGGTDPCAQASLTPARTVRNLKTMAALARARGARAVVLTPPPARVDAFCRRYGHVRACRAPDVVAKVRAIDAYTEAVAAGLRAWPARREQYVLDVRALFAERDWSLFTTDGVHLNADGNRIIAEWLATHENAHR